MDLNDYWIYSGGWMKEIFHCQGLEHYWLNHLFYCAQNPPSIMSSAPVMYEDSSEAK